MEQTGLVSIEKNTPTLNEKPEKRISLAFIEPFNIYILGGYNNTSLVLLF
jgi:hypothetical protein